MRALKIYDKTGKHVDNFTLPAWGLGIMQQKHLSFNQMIRMINKQGYYIKEQLKPLGVKPHDHAKEGKESSNAKDTSSR